MKSKVIWGVLACVAMLLSFIFCRYVFFDLHGMKQWPFYLFMFGLMITVIAAIFEARWVMLRQQQDILEASLWVYCLALIMLVFSLNKIINTLANLPKCTEIVYKCV
jgi:hypothetical protein